MSQILKDLQNKILEYQKNKTEKGFEKISQLISPFVRNFPKFAFHKKDDDTLSEFYLFVFPKLDNIISSYNRERSSLITFLSKVLKNFWISFLRAESSKQKKELSTPSYKIIEEISSDKQLTDPPETNKFSNWLTTEIQNLNDPIKQITLKLYFFDIFTEEDLVSLKEISKKSYKDCLIFLEKILTQSAQKRKKQAFFEERLLRLQRKFFLLQEDPTKISQLEEIRKIYLHKYYSIRSHPSITLIAEFLEKQSKDISNVVYNFRKKVQKIIPEEML